MPLFDEGTSSNCTRTSFGELDCCAPEMKRENADKTTMITMTRRSFFTSITPAEIQLIWLRGSYGLESEKASRGVSYNRPRLSRFTRFNYGAFRKKAVHSFEEYTKLHIARFTFL